MKDRVPPALVLLLALLVPLLSLLTTWQGYHFEHPPERVFMGFRYMAGDHYQYAAFMREAHDGLGLLMYNPFTSEPQRGVFLLPYFWLVGVTARLTGGGVVLWWEVFRVLGGALYILAFWYFTGFYFQHPPERLLSTGLFSIAGGLDWIVTGLRAAGLSRLEPLEYAYDYYWNWSTFGTMQVPNWIWPALLIVLSGCAALGRIRRRDLLIFILLPMAWFLHPYSGMVAYLTFGLLPIVPVAMAPFGIEPRLGNRFRENLRVALPALLSFLVVAGYLLWARSDPVFRANSERGLAWTLTFRLWWYPLSYGLLLPLAWYGLRTLTRERSLRSDLVLAWLAAAVLLSVNPIYAGVKFQYLVFPPLVILSARGMLYLRQNARFMRRLMTSGPGAAVLGVLLCMNAPVSLVKDLPAAPVDRDIYMPAAEIEAMKWLELQPDGPVLSSYRAGNRIPWLTGKRVYAGHWFLTPNLNDRIRDIALFFSPGVPASIRKEVLIRSAARYVFLGPGDQAAGLDHAGLPMSQIYSANGYTIYRVERP